jgi:sporulation protein YlmC with PRC-barrel domain
VSDTFRRARGRKLVSRASAQELGAVSHLLVDAQRRDVAAVVIGRGKKVQLVDWAGLSRFGPDAVMVSDEAALRSPADERERGACAGKLELVGKRALTERGNELGVIDDVTFDAGTGALEHLLVGDREIPAGALLGCGSYAAILDDDWVGGMADVVDPPSVSRRP